MKKILVCFDGTSNRPEDADPRLDDAGALEDENITNVLKLHLLAWGQLGQVSLYFAGPGTRGGTLRRMIESAFAPASLRAIRDRALDQLREVYQPGDSICVFGFSRGAAIARRFVSRLQTLGLASDKKGSVPGKPIPVAFLGVWDTVLSQGLPEKDDVARDPVKLDERNGLGAGVSRVVHLVSIDDPRLVFTPTLFPPDDRVTEVWFAGVHSDVGGGYRQAGLSDLALEFMMNQAKAEAGLSFANPDEIDPSPATDGMVEKDDLAMASSPDAADHAGIFKKFVKEFSNALGPRRVMALRGGVPMIHPSVVERGKLRRDYRPEGLDGVRHSVWNRPDVEYDSFSSHFSDA